MIPAKRPDPPRHSMIDRSRIRVQGNRISPCEYSRSLIGPLTAASPALRRASFPSGSAAMRRNCASRCCGSLAPVFSTMRRARRRKPACSSHAAAVLPQILSPCSSSACANCLGFNLARSRAHTRAAGASTALAVAAGIAAPHRRHSCAPRQPGAEASTYPLPSQDAPNNRKRPRRPRPHAPACRRSLARRSTVTRRGRRPESCFRTGTP